jgi:hypothetical protein
MTDSERPGWRLLGRIADLFGAVTPAVAVILVLWHWQGWNALSTTGRQTVTVSLAVVTLLGASSLITGVRSRWSGNGALSADRGRSETRLMIAGSVLLLAAGAAMVFILLQT